MPTVKKALAGMGLSSFLILATVVAGAISTFMFRAHQLNSERLVEDLVYAKSMLKTHLRSILADSEICGVALNTSVPAVTLDTFDFRLGSYHGILQVSELTWAPGPSGEYTLAWEVTQRNGLPTARRMRDSLTLQYTESPTPSCTLVGTPPPAAAPDWSAARGPMCARLTRFPTTPTGAALADCSMSSLLAGDFPTGPTRWSVESQGVALIGADPMAAVRAGALSNLLVPDGGGNLPTCGSGEAVYNITKPPGASPLSLSCESLTGASPLCSSPCTGAGSTCCRDSGGNAVVYQDGIVQSSAPGVCSVNHPSTAACDAAPQLGSGPGCVAPTFYCPASVPTCSAPSPCTSCCRNEPGGHRNYIGGLPASGILPGPCGSSVSLCGTAQAGVPAGCSPAQFYYCGSGAPGCIATTPPVGLCQPCVRICAQIAQHMTCSSGQTTWACSQGGTNGYPGPPFCPAHSPQISSCNWTTGFCYNTPYAGPPQSPASGFGCTLRTIPGYCVQHQCR